MTRWTHLAEKEERQRTSLRAERAAIIDELLAAPSASVRLVAHLLGIGKSTVHDLQRRSAVAAD